MSKTTQQDRLMSITTPLGEDFLLINRLKATEDISSLYSFEVELLHAEEQDGNEPTAVDPKSILGQAVSIKISQADGPDSKNGTTRHLNGIVNHFSQGHRDVRFSYYYATIVPQVWLLTQITRNRIFQHKNVPDILREVFEGLNVSYEIQGDFKPRNYCVQYRETDFDFASRLMEEEGIYYFFEHKGGKNNMIVANTPQSHLECPSKSDIPYFLKVTQEKGFISSIRKWQNDYRLQSGKVAFWDYHFQTPTNKLDVVQPSLFKVANNDKMEIYDFPGGYARKYDDIDRGGGERSDVKNVFEDKQKKAEIAMQSLDSQYRVITGISNCSALTTGHRFTLFNHPSAAQNADYIITSVTHEAEQHPTYISDDEVRHPYTNSFSCIAYGDGSPPFRPVPKTLKPTVRGSQTAVVVGPTGEEIFTDKFGRVKVQFHWDRENTYTSDSSCWVRVAHDIAGKKWGEMHIPRIGQEVIVDFLEGDPDQPIIVGSVYNNASMPHYELPKYKTLTYLKTRTSPDDGKGFNELRFEDKKGKEQVFVHSQKRMDVRVRQSLYETCGGNRHEVIGVRSSSYSGENYPGGNLAITVGGNYDLHVKGGMYIGIDGKLSDYVKGDVTEYYKSKLSTRVGSSAELNARKITLEALQEINLKVGSSFITLDLTGITISGPIVKINSGGSATGTSAITASEPLDAETADTGEPGYLDRPRYGKGGGRKTWTVEGYHGPEVSYDPATGNYGVGKNIVIKGNDDFKKKALNDVADISSTPTGKKLLNNIDNGTHSVTIQESPTDPRTGKKSPGFATKADPAAAEVPGTGTDTTISYNPDGTKVKDQNGKPIDIPGAEILAHELIHADHNSQGTNLTSQPDPKDPTGNQEESRTIGINDHKDEPISENKLLEDWGKDYRRTDHDGGFVRK